MELVFKHCIVATGSFPAALPEIDFDEEGIMSSKGALDIKDIPKSLLVIGGGYIGLELGSVYSRLGSGVTVVEMTDQLLPGVDRDLVKVFSAKNEKLFQEVMLNTRIVSLKKKGKQVVAALKDEKGKSREEKFDKVLIAIGRKPLTNTLSIEKAGIETDSKGFILTNEEKRTNISHIFAVGDVAGEPMLAHKGSHEGIVAAEVISGKKSAFEPVAIPAVVFTDPEIAWCGLTESEAKKRNIRIKVSRFPWKASGKALAMGENSGVTKLIVDSSSERILGVGIAGKDAGSLISEGVLAVEMGATVKDIALSIHPHPTLSETLMEAAERFYGMATHFKGS